MTTKQAMEHALNSDRVKEDTNPNTLKTLRKRLKEDKLRLDTQLAFLLKFGYIIKHEINWKRPLTKVEEVQVSELTKERIIEATERIFGPDTPAADALQD